MAISSSTYTRAPAFRIATYLSLALAALLLVDFATCAERYEEIWPAHPIVQLRALAVVWVFAAFSSLVIASAFSIFGYRGAKSYFLYVPVSVAISLCCIYGIERFWWKFEPPDAWYLTSLGHVVSWLERFVFCTLILGMLLTVAVLASRSRHRFAAAFGYGLSLVLVFSLGRDASVLLSCSR